MCRGGSSLTISIQRSIDAKGMRQPGVSVIRKDQGALNRTVIERSGVFEKEDLHVLASLSHIQPGSLNVSQGFAKLEDLQTDANVASG